MALAPNEAETVPDIDPEIERQVVRLLHLEALLLDERRFEEWLALYTDDARYWVPAEPGQTDPINHVSIMYEDKAVLRMRVRRLMHPRAYAHNPHPRTTHLVGNIDVLGASAAEITVRSALAVFEVRESVRAFYAGRVHHRLRPMGASLGIIAKRVDLIDCDAVHRNVITVPF